MNDELNKKLIMSHEGRRLKAYRDTRGFLTIGVGFNLDDALASGVCAAAGVDCQATRDGLPITDAECDLIFAHQYAAVAAEARGIFPGIDSYPENAAAVICDMLFQLGRTGFGHFVHTIAAFRAGDWKAAADGIAHSALAEETPHRVLDNCSHLDAIDAG